MHLISLCLSFLKKVVKKERIVIMKKHQITIEPLGITCTANEGTSLYELLRNYPIDFPCGGKEICGNCRIKVLSGKIDTSPVHAEWLHRKGLSDEWRLACMSKIEGDLIIEIPRQSMQIQTDTSRISSFLPEEGYGIAVDLGSTTIVAQLVNLTTSHVSDTCTKVNPQISFGADIISRIGYAMQSKEKSLQLRNIIRACIGEMISSLLSENLISDLKKVVVVGNTVMHHLFAGYDVSPLASAPYQSPRNEGYSLSPSDLKWTLPSSCTVTFLPNLSHFVGSDILCGIQASEMANRKEYTLLIDLGTNGEMALGNRERIVYTSTAAGPAFEGVNISCGMRATTGAIYAVEENGNQGLYKTIGGRKPLGICGSGLIEVIHRLLTHEYIDMTGAMTNPECTAIHLAEGVDLTIDDIREFQLAKAALAAGMELLLKEYGIKAEQVARVYLTGGLGNYLNVEKAKRLGLFRDFDSNHITRLENAALAGCRQFLFESNRHSIASILKRATFCPLENKAEFQDIFCEQLFFAYSH